MNKKQLIEAIKDYPDDVVILVAVGWHLAELDKGHEDGSTVTYNPPESSNAVPFSISSDPDNIILEL